MIALLIRFNIVLNKKVGFNAEDGEVALVGLLSGEVLLTWSLPVGVTVFGCSGESTLLNRFAMFINEKVEVDVDDGEVVLLVGLLACNETQIGAFPAVAAKVTGVEASESGVKA